MISWFEIFGLISLCFAVAGSLLNNRKMILCFPVWMVANIICVMMHLRSGIFSLALKDAIFMYICVDGYLRWRKKK